MSSRPRSRSTAHHGRTTESDDVHRRSRSKSVTLTAWLIIIGLGAAVVLPVLALLLG